MRQLVVGIVAAAALVSSNVAQASRPSDRPNEYGGGHAGSVVAATNPYQNVERQGLMRAQERMAKKSNFHASRPADSSGAKDFAAQHTKAISSNGGHGMAGSVKAALNPYRTTEVMGIARAKERALKKTNFCASQPADSSGAKDFASKSMKALASGGGHGMAGSVKAALNPYRTTEIMGIARGQERMAKKSNFHASRPADSSGAKDFAAQHMKALSGSGRGGGIAGSIRTALNPYTRLEKAAVANGMKRAQSKAGADAPTPKGLGDNAIGPRAQPITGHSAGTSSIDLRLVPTITPRDGQR